MKKGKYSATRHGLRGTGVLALMLALVLAVGGVAGGTIAWLTARTPEISNTFTVGNITLNLTESTTNVPSTTGATTVVPGQTFTKDTAVVVGANSVKCYLFLRIDEKDNVIPQTADKKIFAWEFNNPDTDSDGKNDWTQYGSTNYYYRVVEASSSPTTFKLVVDNKLTISKELTKENADTLTQQSKNPSLSFSAAAVQFDAIGEVTGETDVERAYNLLPEAFKNP